MLRFLATLCGLLACLATASVADAHKQRGHHHGHHGKAQHSLRAAVTDQNFYFVMADRFENGTAANDHGGLPPGKSEGQSGFDPTGKGWYHGGDLKGMLDRIDYIEDLGTTAIWLTPSFKNKAVQDNDGFPSAGYHGYWITDFTQIDPHLGSNADLRALVDAAHARGMKVYFDIITNHTADVIRYQNDDGSLTGRPYISKDRAPYKTASGQPFDDRDYAGTNTFPPLSPTVSFPFRPVVPAAETGVKFPDWLDDVNRYHNRGNTTFVGENSYYGDFFGLDDLFTEQPQVVDGMIDIYKQWITDFRIDGFRIDTMKHVNDEFWEKFAPAILDHARRQGLREFYAFGEVFDITKPFTSHFTTQANVQGVLDFPFQKAAERFAANSVATNELRDFFVDDDWYTDADSNVYQLPTFLGNHDMGRIGLFIRNANPGATDAEVFQRDKLAHELMYFSRGNPVIYYGDEQGFVGDGGDQDARQDMFPSQVATYNDDDLIATDATTAQSNFDTGHPLFQTISNLAEVADRYPALRDGAHQHRYSSDAPGIYAYSRLNRRERREFVVAVNNSESAQTALVPTWAERGWFTKVYGTGATSVRSGSDKRLSVTVPALSTIVYRADKKMHRSHRAPQISLTTPAEARDRLEVRANVSGDSFYEVTFKAKVGRGRWKSIGTDDTAPYRVFQDVADYKPGTRIRYKAVVLDNAGHTRTSSTRSSRVAVPSITLEAPNDGARVRGEVEVRAVTVPEHPWYEVQFQRSVNGGAWTNVGSPDTSSPVYTHFDDTSALPDGATVSYRAVLDYANRGTRTVTSESRSVTIVQARVTTATVHYFRPAGDYLDWGLHLWGDAIADGVATDWAAPRQRDEVVNGEAIYRIPLKDDTKPVNFIMHRPSGDSVPTTREPGGDRSFVPLEHPEIWLVQGDPTVYTTDPTP
ncbi:MAG TPA: alpha-amylase family glycosyl hydrolase [Solirubrobacteraceae bacterium]|nr:alpha-amylase family glycosyl hydrolase [Solirubrobacteraceae bacterium]